jgi:hypothetical protein
MRQFLKKAVVGMVTLALVLSFVDVTQASSQGSAGKDGKPGIGTTVAKGKGGGKGKGGKGKGKGKNKGKGMAKGKGKGKGKHRDHKWRHSRFSGDYGTTLYSDDGDDTLYYWCQPDGCYYPVDYCPYGKYSWDE